MEEVFEALEDVTAQLEKEQVSLEESFALYHKGIDLLKICNEKIDKVEKKMLILDEDGEQHEF